MGRYTIITWGNMLEGQPFEVIPEFELGVTTIDEARLVLQQYADNLRLENLFFGERQVDIPLYYSKTDTVSLINNTHNVRVVLHWDHTGAPVDHSQAVDYNEVIVAVTSSNMVYDFRNNAQTANDYYYQTGQIVRKYNPYYTDLTGDTLRRENQFSRKDTRNWMRLYYPNNIDAGQDSMVFDFRILRMTVDQEVKLSVMRKKPLTGLTENLFAMPPYIGNPDRYDDPVNPIKGVDIIGKNSHTDIEATGYNKLFRSDAGIRDLPEELKIKMQQRQFDINEYYRIDVYLKYEDIYDSYVTGGVHIVDWHKVR
jgi:hypothetical protein